MLPLSIHGSTWSLFPLWWTLILIAIDFGLRGPLWRFFSCAAMLYLFIPLSPEIAWSLPLFVFLRATVERGAWRWLLGTSALLGLAMAQNSIGLPHPREDLLEFFGVLPMAGLLVATLLSLHALLNLESTSIRVRAAWVFGPVLLLPALIGGQVGFLLLALPFLLIALSESLKTFPLLVLSALLFTPWLSSTIPLPLNPPIALLQDVLRSRETRLLHNHMNLDRNSVLLSNRLDADILQVVTRKPALTYPPGTQANDSFLHIGKAGYWILRERPDEAMLHRAGQHLEGLRAWREVTVTTAQNFYIYTFDRLKAPF